MSRRLTLTASPIGSCFTSLAPRPEPNTGHLPNVAGRSCWRPSRLTIDPLPQLAAPELSPLAAELVKRGVTDTAAADLVSSTRPTPSKPQIEILDWLMEKKPAEKFTNPVLSGVRHQDRHTPAPKGFKTKAERQADEEAARQAHQNAVEAEQDRPTAKGQRERRQRGGRSSKSSNSAPRTSRIAGDAVAEADEQTRQMFENPPTPTFADTHDAPHDACTILSPASPCECRSWHPASRPGFPRARSLGRPATATALRARLHP